MAKRTYADVVEQINKLQAEAESLKQSEIDDVVGRIRQAVDVYGLTPEDIFGRRAPGKPAGKSAGRAAAKSAAKPARSTSGRRAAYADGQGNEWGGRGPRPRWLREALAGGASLESFKVGGNSSGPARNGAASNGSSSRKSAAGKKGRGGRRMARQGSDAPAAAAAADNGA